MSAATCHAAGDTPSGPSSSSYSLVPGSALGERADGGGVADPEQGELQPVASAGVGLAGEPVCAEILRGDARPAHGLLDVAAADGLETAGGAPVDQQVRVGGGRPAGTAVRSPVPGSRPPPCPRQLAGGTAPGDAQLTIWHSQLRGDQCGGAARTPALAQRLRDDGREAGAGADGHRRGPAQVASRPSRACPCAVLQHRLRPGRRLRVCPHRSPSKGRRLKAAREPDAVHTPPGVAPVLRMNMRSHAS